MNPKRLQLATFLTSIVVAVLFLTAAILYLVLSVLQVEFLAGLGAAALAACGDGAEDGTAIEPLDYGDWDPADEQGPIDALTDATAAFFPPQARAAARALGEAYSFERQNAAGLERELLVFRLSLAANASTEERVNDLRGRVPADFDSEAVLLAGGWHLSRTEVLLAVWAARSATDPRNSG